SHCHSSTWEAGDASCFRSAGRRSLSSSEPSRTLTLLPEKRSHGFGILRRRHPRRFYAYMIYSQQRRCIIDYLGSHQHLAVDIRLSVDQRGGICLRSGSQRFYEGVIGFTFPLLFSGVADVCEWYEEG